MVFAGWKWYAALALTGMSLSAAVLGQVNSDRPLGATAQARPDYLKKAGIVERLNQQLPLAVPFTDETGRAVTYGTYFGQRPLALALVYFRCQMLCPQVLHGMAVGLNQSGFRAGKDFDVLVASIDPTDTPADAAKAKTEFLEQLGQGGAGSAAAGAVHFLTGPQASIDALSDATGFQFVRIPGPDGKMDQFAHASAVMFATPQGKLSEYLSGIDYPSRDVRLALVNASNGKIATARDLFLLYCCNYVPTSGKYTVAVVRVLGLAGMVTVGAVIAGLWLLTRKRAGAPAAV